MPITITEPALNQPTGPGFLATWTSDFIGPLPLGSFFRVQLFGDQPSGEQLFWSLDYPTQTVNGVVSLGFGQSGGVIVPTPRSWMPQAATAKFVVELRQDNTTILDQGSHNVVWDPATSSSFITSQLASQVPTGGYTQADRDVAAATQKAVFTTFPLTDILGSVADIGLGLQFGCPPEALLIPQLHGDLSGDGTLTRPSADTGVYAYGFMLRTVEVPPRLTVEFGRSLEYADRLAQFLVIKTDFQGNEFISDRYHVHHDQERFCWQIPFPRRIEYSILPGVTMRFFWLLFPVGQ